MAVWKWYNWVAASCPQDRKVLRVNLDESSICLHQGMGRGNVVTSHRESVFNLEPFQKVNRTKHRTNFTYIGIICQSNL